MSKLTLQSSMYDAIVPWQFGSLGLIVDDNSICRIDFLGRRTAKKPTGTQAIKAVESLQAYLKQAESYPEFPVKFAGTDFQKKVWQALRAIDVGQVVTYGDLARQLDSSPRAIGGACRQNPVPVLVPCHRVVSATGLGGFAGKQDGKMMAIKRWLLAHEGLEFR